MKQENKKPPKFLYRYFLIDKYAEYIFKHNELHFRNPDHFNDPFDCKPFLTFGRNWNQKEYINFVINTAGGSIGRSLNNKEKQLCKKQAIDVFENCDRNQLNKNINNTIKDSLDESINEFRILCLSENYNDILMWSHYADGHRGFVLQFDTKALLRNFSPIQKVFYPPKESFPSIKDFNERNCEHMFLTTKSSHWAYEEEWRILMHIEDKDNPEDEGKVYKFKNGLITGIILGCNIDNTDKDRIYMWRGYCKPKPTIYKAFKDQNFYTINVDPPI